MSSNKALLREILEDLPALLKESPLGITLGHLHEWYGESQLKLSKAVKELHAQNMVDLRRGPQSTMLVFPKGKAPEGSSMSQLTPLQAKLLQLLREAHREKGASLHTNFARLANACKASYGGTRAALQKLEQLKLVLIEGQSMRGKQDQLIINIPETNHD